MIQPKIALKRNCDSHFTGVRKGFGYRKSIAFASGLEIPRFSDSEATAQLADQVDLHLMDTETPAKIEDQHQAQALSPTAIAKSVSSTKTPRIRFGTGRARLGSSGVGSERAGSQSPGPTAACPTPINPSLQFASPIETSILQRAILDAARVSTMDQSGVDCVTHPDATKSDLAKSGAGSLSQTGSIRVIDRPVLSSVMNWGRVLAGVCLVVGLYFLLTAWNESVSNSNSSQLPKSVETFTVSHQRLVRMVGMT